MLTWIRFRRLAVFLQLSWNPIKHWNIIYAVELAHRFYVASGFPALSRRHEGNYFGELQPDTRCQVCLSAEDVITKDTRDRLIQCSLCLSTIHQDHYGSELLAGAPTKWYCQRCQYLLSKDHQITSISCEYCPSRTGIMKMVEVDRKKLWVPYCAIQVHP